MTLAPFSGSDGDPLGEIAATGGFIFFLALVASNKCTPPM